MNAVETAVRPLASLTGRALSVVINDVWGLGRARPLHPKGETHDAVWITEPGSRERLGSRLLDEPGAYACSVRVSRAVGLPDGWPDIEGVALKFADPDGGDLLFAGTGAGRLSRYCLVPRWGSGRCTTLFPLRSETGHLVLGLDAPDDDGCRVIRVASPAGGWRRLGVLQPAVAATGRTDAEPRHNPVVRPPFGLRHPPVLAALRGPAYARAQGD